MSESTGELVHVTQTLGIKFMLTSDSLGSVCRRQKEGGREGEKERWREGEREGGTEGHRERWRERGTEIKMERWKRREFWASKFAILGISPQDIITTNSSSNKLTGFCTSPLFCWA